MKSADMVQVLNPNLLMPWGKALLLAALGVSLVRTMRGMTDFTLVIERFVVGFLGILFFQPAALLLQDLSDSLLQMVQKLGHQGELKTLILDALKQAARAPTTSGGRPLGGVNLPSLLEQAWRIGVWGVMASVVEFAYLVVSLLLECAQAVFLKILLLLFPLACGVYPVFPRVFYNFCAYAVELALWFPVLTLIEIATGTVAKSYLTKAGSWGLYVVAIELIAILLIATIPSLVHRCVSGALSGDLDASSSVVQWAKRAMAVAASTSGGATAAAAKEGPA